jgi:hypothetical protein
LSHVRLADEIEDCNYSQIVIDRVVHVVVHVIVHPSCPILEVELVVFSSSGLQLDESHNELLNAPLGESAVIQRNQSLSQIELVHDLLRYKLSQSCINVGGRCRGPKYLDFQPIKSLHFH